MLYEQGLSPVTVNVRLRTLGAFLRFSYKEGYIQQPIHEDLKILRTPQDLIESFTAEEIRKLCQLLIKKVIQDSVMKIKTISYNEENYFAVMEKK